MPDSAGEVTSAVDGGDSAVLEITWNGTFTGPWGTPDGDVEPTGKHQTTRACVIATFDGDAIKESHQYFDSMSLMQQLGMLEAPASV
jgi:ketosteroid isomerase-like protein